MLKRLIMYVLATHTQVRGGLASFVLEVGDNVISTTAENYICFGTDWWPADKCDYEDRNGRTHAQACSWGGASIINQDLAVPRLRNAMAAIAPVTWRLGGSLCDYITYNFSGGASAPFLSMDFPTEDTPDVLHSAPPSMSAMPCQQPSEGLKNNGEGNKQRARAATPPRSSPCTTRRSGWASAAAA
jgi:hypothetical protein